MRLRGLISALLLLISGKSRYFIFYYYYDSRSSLFFCFLTAPASLMLSTFCPLAVVSLIKNIVAGKMRIAEQETGFLVRKYSLVLFL